MNGPIPCLQNWANKVQQMSCPAPLLEGEKSPLLTALLTEEPHVVIPRAPKPQKGRAGLRKRETWVTRSEETHASSTHESDGGRTRITFPQR